MTPSPQPTTRYKTFEYTVETRWVRDRVGTLGSSGKPDVRVASPPEFKGEPGIWTPEDLFVAAIDACQMTTFLALASRASIGLLSYESHAKGILEFTEGGYRFTRVVLTPTITVVAGTDSSEVATLVENAHRSCLVGRSVRTDIAVSPEIIIGRAGE
jgi:peroxiredoxin-like protein